MCIFKQIEILEANISKVHDPALLFAMNKKHLELQEQIKELKKIQVHICQN